MMKVPMLDLVKQYHLIKNEIDHAVQEVLESGAYIMGPQVAELERSMGQFLNVSHCLGVASGSDALILALDAMGIGPGDRVAVPTFTFFATAGAVVHLGAEPVFIDIEPDSYNLDLEQLEAVLERTSGIKAVIPVHVFGRPCDMEAIMNMAAKHGLSVVEDACQAIDADVQNGKRGFAKAGSMGHAGCFSFFPSKNLSCYGDGGMIVTSDQELANRIKVMRVHGAEPKYHHSIVGYNSRLDTLQAAMLLVKLRYLPEWTEGRRRVARTYDALFSQAGLQELIKWPAMQTGHVFHQYVIEVEDRDGMAAYLSENGVSTAVYYPVPLHLQECFASLGYQPGQLPVAEAACQRVLALPVDPAMRESDLEYIVEKIAAFPGLL